MFKDKILAELRKKFAGLPANILGQIADKLAAKATEESQIEGLITELDNLPISLPDYAKLIQQEGDRRVTEAEKKWKAERKSDPDPDPKNDPMPDNTLAKKIEALEKQLADWNKEKSVSQLTEQLHAKLKEEKIPVQFAKGFLVDKAEDLDTVLASVKEHYTSTKQEMINQGLMTAGAPVGGGTPLKTDNIDADIAAWAGAGKKSETK